LRILKKDITGKGNCKTHMKCHYRGRGVQNLMIILDSKPPGFVYNYARQAAGMIIIDFFCNLLRSLIFTGVLR